MPTDDPLHGSQEGACPARLYARLEKGGEYRPIVAGPIDGESAGCL